MSVLRGLFWFLGMVAVSGGLAVGAMNFVPVKEDWEYMTLLWVLGLLFFFAAVAWTMTERQVLHRLAADGWKRYVAAVAYYLLWCGFFFFVVISLFAELG